MKKQTIISYIIILIALIFLLIILWPEKSSPPIVPDNNILEESTSREAKTSPQTTNTTNTGTTTNVPPEPNNPGTGNNQPTPTPGTPPTAPTVTIDPNLPPTLDLGNGVNLPLPPTNGGTTSPPPVQIEPTTLDQGIPEINLTPDTNDITLDLGTGSGVVVEETNQSGTLSQIRVFNLTASEWSFTPPTITANINDIVRINITSNDSSHCLSLPGYNQFADVPAGGSGSVEFRVDRSGSFNFFCPLSYSEGRSDMNGTLIVNE